MTKINLFGLDFISEDNLDCIVKVIFKDIDNVKFPIISTPNVDQMVKLSKNSEIKQFIKESFLILPDGQPIVLASKLLGKPLKKRLCGSDLFPLVWNEIKCQNKKVFIVAPSEYIASLFRIDYPLSTIYVPPFFKESDIETLIMQANIVSHMLEEDNYEYVFLGLGFPKQELLSKNIILLSSKQRLYFLLGASFEFYFGTKKRAPLWMQSMGLEWLHRFASEPKRLFKRYFIDSWYFFILILNEIRKK